MALALEVRAATAPRDDGGKAPGVFAGYNPALTEKLVVTATDAGPLVEQYRKLAATLHHSQEARGTRVVMIASAIANEGKTLTASNLALTLSESYRRRVLLIDADLRRPSLHTVFQIPNVHGLNDELKSNSSAKIAPVEISDHLSVVTAGRPDPDPMSGLTSNRMRQIVQDAAAAYDWVVIDTPPVGLLPDANLLAAMVDAALLVIAAGRTPYRLVERAASTLGRDRILGVVLNRVEQAAVGGGYYNYYGYYGSKSSNASWWSRLR
jgi:capsular exopolysaccharide synthesis family protein